LSPGWLTENWLRELPVGSVCRWYERFIIQDYPAGIEVPYAMYRVRIPHADIDDMFVSPACLLTKIRIKIKIKIKLN